MNIDFKDEYATLRQEMLGQFERIHDTTKYGIGGFILFLSYYWHDHSSGGTFALLVLQFIVLLIGLYVLKLYRSIYIKGAYIAIVIEGTTRPRWHRMSRSVDKYLSGGHIKKQCWVKKQLDRLPYPIGERWGSDSAQYSIIILFLCVSAIFAVVLLADLSAFITRLLQSWRPLSFLFIGLSFILIVLNLFIIYRLWFMDDTEKWKEYCNDFGGEKFPDPYNETTKNTFTEKDKSENAKVIKK